MVDFNVSLPQTKVTWIEAHPKNCPVYFSGYRKTCLCCEWHLPEPVQIKRGWQKELNPPSVCQASRLSTELTYSVVAAASVILIRATVSRLLSWTKDQWLSRKLPGLQQQIGTAEAPILVDWANSGCRPPQWQALGDNSNHWGTSLQDKAVNRFSASWVRVSCCCYFNVIWLDWFIYNPCPGFCSSKEPSFTQWMQVLSPSPREREHRRESFVIESECCSTHRLSSPWKAGLWPQVNLGCITGH